MDEEAWTEGELNAFLKELDERLHEARQHPNSREARFMLTAFSLRTIAEMKPPIGLGLDIDKLLIKPIAAAILLQKAIQRAERALFDDQDEVAAVSKAAERLRDALIPISERLSDVEIPPEW